MVRNYIPITVAYRKKSGNKIWVKEFTDQRCPDKLITKRGTKLPEGCEIVALGVGSKFYKHYKQKYEK
jgi:hypothetical protein